MKAKLVMRITIPEDESDGWLELHLVLDNKRLYDMLSNEIIKVSKDDLDNYLEKLDEVINEAFILINAIPGLKLAVDQSVCEFIPESSDEIRSYIKKLLVEI